jgi:hypothetical protein
MWETECGSPARDFPRVGQLPGWTAKTLVRRKIIDKRGHSCVLDLPENYKMKIVFHADRLRLASMDPLPGQREDPPPPAIVDGEPEYDMARQMDSRTHYGELQYQADWKGHDPDDTCYPARNFKNSMAALNRFHEDHPRGAGPPLNLKKWLLAAAEARSEEDDAMDNVALQVTHKTRTQTRYPCPRSR